ncbi:MAG: hypothetical protein ACI80K_001590 [Paracoccaceae bacterium]|jgi:hypothetical protein
MRGDRSQQTRNRPTPMKHLLDNALEIAGAVLLVGFCVQWTLMGTATPADGFAEMKRAALVVDQTGKAPEPVWLADRSIGAAAKRVALQSSVDELVADAR